MVLKKDDHTADFCQSIDDSEDSSSGLLASEWRKDQKGLRQDNDCSSGNRGARDAKEGFCSGTDTNECETGLVNCLGKGDGVVDLRNSPGSLGLNYDMEDKHLESSKHTQSSEATNLGLFVSPSDINHGQNENIMLSNEVMNSDEKREPSVQTSPGDDVDESDVEEDVKVCDICGDAGREDLLAVCSRCCDGAEHTYCMRVMLEKVPEGDWFCEECKHNEELEAQKQEHVKLRGSFERSKSLGRTTSVNSDLSTKLVDKDSLDERTKFKTVSLSRQLSTKRPGDSFEAGSTAKKQVLESSAGSPTALSPMRVPMLSRNCSLKNFDKTKGKPTNQFSTGTESAGDSSESTRSPTRNSPHNLKGNFAKPNSFGSSNLKANVQVSEVVQKQKQGGVDAKDGPRKLVGKSMSFKGLSRSSLTEPKVKMLSSKCAPVQEVKGQKQVRDRGSFERKNSAKLDNAFPVQTATNSTKRLSRADNHSTSSLSSSRDYKNDQPDVNLTSLSKQMGNVVHKSSDAMGEVTRPATNIRGPGTSNFAEAKPCHVSFKDGSPLNPSWATDGSLVSHGTKVEVHENQSEKALENNISRSRQVVNGALNRRGISSDVSMLRAKDGVHEENKLKAAIEAAMQKKQHIFKKNKISEKLNELPASIIQENHVGDGGLNQTIYFTVEEEVHARDVGLSSHASGSCKHTSINSVKEFKVYPSDIVNLSEEDSVLTLSAIPEQEAVWQGGFEIHRNGKFSDVCGGFQAHVSSIASSKVLEVVRKLPQIIVFNEVSRSCAWPNQFRETGAQEDNIALYFFAKDLESYLRSFKNMLEYMIKHDLALKGNINGVELLVFPSNQLAHRSQRWNTLFFMWGVLQGRRKRCSDDRKAPLESFEISRFDSVSRDNDVASTAYLSEDTCVQRPAISDTVLSRSEDPVLDGPSPQISGYLSNGDRYDQGYKGGRTCLSSPISIGNLEKRTENYSSAGAEACSVSGTAALEDHCQLNPNNEPMKSMSDLMLEKRDNSSHSSKVFMVGKQEGFSASASAVEKQEVLPTVSNNADEKFENNLKHDHYVDTIQKIRGQVKLENNVEQVEMKASMWKNNEVKIKSEGRLKKEGYMDINVSADYSMEDLHSLSCSPRRHSDEDSTEPTIEAASAIPCLKRPWVDRKDGLEGADQACISKRIKEDDGFYGCDPRRLPSSYGDSSATLMHDVSTSSRFEDTSNDAVDENLTSVKPESAERCFFLADSHAALRVSSEDNLLPWKVSLSGNENRLPDGSPNLELALGVEKKRSRIGVLPFFAGIVDRKGPDRPPDIASPKEEIEDASASLSLSLAFPFSDEESPVRSGRSLTTLEQVLPAGHEASTSLLLFRGSSGK